MIQFRCDRCNADMTKKSLFWHQIQVFAVYNVFVTVSLFFAIFNFWTRDVSCCATLSYTNINTFLKKKIQFVIPPPKLNKLNVIEFLREELFAQFYMFFLLNDLPGVLPESTESARLQQNVNHNKLRQISVPGVTTIIYDSMPLNAKFYL